MSLPITRQTEPPGVPPQGVRRDGCAAAGRFAREPNWYSQLDAGVPVETIFHTNDFAYGVLRRLGHQEARSTLAALDRCFPPPNVAVGDGGPPHFTIAVAPGVAQQVFNASHKLLYFYANSVYGHVPNRAAPPTADDAAKAWEALRTKLGINVADAATGEFASRAGAIPEMKFLGSVALKLAVMRSGLELLNGPAENITHYPKATVSRVVQKAGELLVAMDYVNFGSATRVTWADACTFAARLNLEHVSLSQLRVRALNETNGSIGHRAARAFLNSASIANGPVTHWTQYALRFAEQIAAGSRGPLWTPCDVADAYVDSPRSEIGARILNLIPVGESGLGGFFDRFVIAVRKLDKVDVGRLTEHLFEWFGHSLFGFGPSRGRMDDSVKEIINGVITELEIETTETEKVALGLTPEIEARSFWLAAMFFCARDIAHKMEAEYTLINQYSWASIRAPSSVDCEGHVGNSIRKFVALAASGGKTDVGTVATLCTEMLSADCTKRTFETKIGLVSVALGVPTTAPYRNYFGLPDGGHTVASFVSAAARLGRSEPISDASRAAAWAVTAELAHSVFAVPAGAKGISATILAARDRLRTFCTSRAGYEALPADVRIALPELLDLARQGEGATDAGKRYASLRSLFYAKFPMMDENQLETYSVVLAA